MKKAESDQRFYIIRATLPDGSYRYYDRYCSRKGIDYSMGSYFWLSETVSIQNVMNYAEYLSHRKRCRDREDLPKGTKYEGIAYPVVFSPPLKLRYWTHSESYRLLTKYL